MLPPPPRSQAPNLEIFSSQDPNFGNFQLTRPQIWKFSVHKTPNLEISVHKTPFSEAMISSQDPLFGGNDRFTRPTLRKSGPHTPTEKKLSAPPGNHVATRVGKCKNVTSLYYLEGILLDLA